MLSGVERARVGAERACVGGPAPCVDVGARCTAGHVELHLSQDKEGGLGQEERHGQQPDEDVDEVRHGPAVCSSTRGAEAGGRVRAGRRTRGRSTGAQQRAWRSGCAPLTDGGELCVLVDGGVRPAKHLAVEREEQDGEGHDVQRLVENSCKPPDHERQPAEQSGAAAESLWSLLRSLAAAAVRHRALPPRAPRVLEPVLVEAPGQPGAHGKRGGHADHQQVKARHKKGVALRGRRQQRAAWCCCPWQRCAARAATVRHAPVWT